MIQSPHISSDVSSGSFTPLNLAQNVKSRPSGSRIIRPLSLLAVKKMDANPTFSPLRSISSKHLIIKYFGAKVTIIQSTADLSRLYRKSQYFKEFAVEIGQEEDEALNHYAPRLRQDKLLFEGRSIKSTCPIYMDQEFYEENAGFENGIIIAPKYQRMTSRLVGSTSKIKIMKLTIDTKQLKMSVRLVQSLTSVQKMAIAITHHVPSDEADMNELSQFLSAVLKLKSLVALKLSFVSHIVTSEFLRRFLSKLVQSNVTDWYLNMKMAEESQLNASLIKGALGKLDSLGITIEHLDEEQQRDDMYDPDHKYLECDCNAKTIRELLSQGKRALHMHFYLTPESKPMKLQPILDSCRLLQNLYLSIDIDEDNWKNPWKGLSKEAPWAKHLQNVVLNSNAHHDHGEDHGKYDDDIARHEDHKTRINAQLRARFSPLLKILETKAAGLKFLRLFCCENNFYQQESHGFAIHAIGDFKDELKVLQSLEHLDLTFNRKLDKGSLADTFSSLKNLTRIDLTLCPIKLYAWDESFPFESLPNLRELNIVIRTNQKNHFEPYNCNIGGSDNDGDNDDSRDEDEDEDDHFDDQYNDDYAVREFDHYENNDKQKTEWGADFAEGIPKLAHLQVLSIVGHE